MSEDQGPERNALPRTSSPKNTVLRPARRDTLPRLQTTKKRAGFAVSTVLYLLALMGVGASVLYSGYGQILRSNVQVTNNVNAKNELNGAATTLAATSEIGTDGQTFCPPGSLVKDADQDDGVCDPDATELPLGLTPFASVPAGDLSKLPTNYAQAGTTGIPVGDLPETGVYAAGAGMKQLDPWGRFYVYCRWEHKNTTGAGGEAAYPAYSLLSAGADGKLDTKCGDTSPVNDDQMYTVQVSEAIQRAAVWQAKDDSTVRYGQTGTQVTITATGGIEAKSLMIETGTATLAGLNVTGEGAFGSLLVSGTSTLSTVTAGSTYLGSLWVTNGTNLNTLAASTATITAVASTTGSITSLTAGTATVTDGYILTLTSSGGSINALTSSTATITALNASSGAIDTLSAAAGGITSLTAGTATVTGALYANQATLGAPLPVTSGGTGGTTAASARNNLGSGGTSAIGDILFTSATTQADAWLILGLTGTAQPTLNIDISGNAGSATTADTANHVSWATGDIVPIEHGGTEAANATAALNNLFNEDAGGTETIKLARIEDYSLPSTKMTLTGVAAGTYNWGSVDAAGRVLTAKDAAGLDDGAGNRILLSGDWIYFMTASVTRVAINPSGYLGLDTGTPAPAERFHVNNGNIRISGPSETSRELQYADDDGTKRWTITTNSTAESGSNAGSNFTINSFSDTGTAIGTPFSITRSTGNATFSNSVGIGNDLVVGGTLYGDSATFSGTITGNISGQISLTDGSAAAPSLYFTNDTNVGMYRPGADQLSIVTNGTNAIYVDALQNVGINKVPDPAYRLDVNGVINATGLFLNGATAGTIIVGTATGQTPYWNGTGWAPSDNIFNTDGSGNVGIGTTTANQKLDVNGNINVNAITQGYYIANTKILHQPASDTTSVGVGSGALAAQSATNLENTALGYNALNATTTGYENVAVGMQALRQTTTGSGNTSVGAGTLTANTTGSSNTAVGVWAQQNNITGQGNTSLGANTLQTSTGADYNTAIGVWSLQNNVGGGNTGVGAGTLTANTSGTNNVAVGVWSLGANTTGEDNVAIGNNALNDTTTGNYNTAVGSYSLNKNINGGLNVAIGMEALGGNTSGDYNIGLGAGSGKTITTGIKNVIIGHEVASTTLATGSNNILIGTSSQIDAPAADTSDFLNIGNTIFGDLATRRVMLIGATATDAGNTPTAGTVLDLSKATGTAYSSLLLPKDTSANRPGTGVPGMIRYNTTTSQVEAYMGSAWTSLGSTATAGSVSYLGASATAANPSRSDDVTTGLFSATASSVAIATAGVEQITVTGTGYVGIGHPTPSYKLHVVNDADADLIFRIDGADISTEYYSVGIASGQTLVRAGGGGTTDNSLLFQTSSGGVETDRMIITATGSVGIGTTSPTTGTLLDVYGATTANSSIIVPRGTSANRPATGVEGMIRYNTTTRAFEGYSGSSPAWGSLVSGTATVGSTMYLGASATAASPSRSDDVTTGLFSDTASSVAIATAGTERLRVTATGSIGVGTSTVGTPVHAYHATNDSVAEFESGDALAQVLTKDNTATAYFGNQGTTAFMGQTSGLSASNLNVTSAGTVGIGTTAPNRMLDIYKAGESSIGLASFTSTQGDSSNVALIKSASDVNGTFAQTASGDRLGTVTFSGVTTGGTEGAGAQIRSWQTGAAGANYVPGEIRFRTSSGSSSLADRMTITSAGAVGIGTATPTTGALLDITGSGTADSSIIVPRGTSANRPGTGVEGMIRYNTTTRAFEGYSGSSPAWGSLVSGTATVGSTMYLGASATAASPSRSDDVTTGLFSDTASSVAIATAGTERLRVTATGSVGIGTADPTYKLEVVADSGQAVMRSLSRQDSTSAYAGFFAHSMSADSSTDTLVSIFAHANERTISRYGLTLGGWSEITTGTAANNTNGLVIGVYQEKPMVFGTNNTERMRIDETGRVGIGTATPTNKLHVEGTAGGSAGIYLNSATPANNTYTLYNNAGTLTWAGSALTTGSLSTDVLLGTATSTTNPHRSGDATTGFYSPAASTIGVVTAGTEALRVTATGSIGIGTTTPGYLLDVAGSANFLNIGVASGAPSSSYAINSNITFTGISGQGFRNLVTNTSTTGLTANRNTYGVYSALTNTADYTATYSNTLYGDYNNIVNSDGYSYSNAFGAYNYVLNNDTTKTNTTSIGTLGQVYNNAAGTLTSARGTQGTVINNAYGTITNAYGSYNQIRNDEGQIPTAYGVYSWINQSTATGTIDTSYAFYARQDRDAGSSNNAYLYYGTYEGTHNTKWGIYLTGETKNYFSGAVGIGTTMPEGLLDMVQDSATAWSTAFTGSQSYDPFPHEVYIKNGQDNTPGSFAGLFLYAGETTDGSEANTARIGAIRESGFATSLGFATRQSGGSLVEGLRLTSTQSVGIGTSDPVYNLHVQSTTDPAAVTVEGIGIVGPHFIGRRARGTPTSLTAVVAGDNLAMLDGIGYGTTGWSSAGRAQITMKSAETWTDSAQGTYISFYTTATGTTATTERARIGASGSMGIGTTSITAGAILDIFGDSSTNSSIIVPRATTANRPGTGVPGMIRYNTTTSQMEAYVGSAWTNLSGSATSGSVIYLGASTANTSPSRGDDVTTGLFSDTASTVAIATAGTERLRVTATGSVGIGTTTPAALLDVNGGAYISGGTLGIGVAPISTASIYTSNTLTGQTNYGMYNMVTTTATLTAGRTQRAIYNYLLMQNPENGYNAVGYAAHNTAYVDNSNTFFQLMGSYNAATTTSNATSDQDNLYGSLSLAYLNGAGTVSSAFGAYNLAQKAASTTGTINTAYGSYNYVRNSATGSDVTDGAINTAYGVYSLINKATGGANFTTAYAFYGSISSATTAWGMYMTGEDKNYFSGAVGIGTATPTTGARLDIYGTATSNSSIVVPRGTSANRPTTGVNGMIRYNSTTNLFEFYQNSAWVNYTTSSDERLKKEIKPVKGALDMVDSMNPVYFKWNKDNPRADGLGDDRRKVGFVAQELEKVLPEVVNTGGDTYRSVEYGQISAVAIAAIKELKAAKSEQDQKLARLEKENDELRQKLANLRPSTERKPDASVTQSAHSAKEEDARFETVLWAGGGIGLLLLGMMGTFGLILLRTRRDLQRLATAANHKN